MQNRVPNPRSQANGVTAIAAGGAHTLALKKDGSVLAWGAGKTAHGGQTSSEFGQSIVPAGLTGVTAIAAGALHSVALKRDGSVVAWGADGYFNYGQATVPVAAQSGVRAIAAGSLHTLALKEDGSVLAWGNGQTNVPAAALSGVTAIAAGGYHSVALKSDGSVVAWGADGYGQTDLPVEARRGVLAIAAGEFHTVALVLPTAPAITSQPVSQTVELGHSATFNMTATGYPLFYQWQRDGIDINGATNASYAFQIATTNQSGVYSVVVSNSIASVTSAPAVLTVTAFPPAIITQPLSQKVQVGRTASFFINASGSVLSYQWFKDGAEISGATSATLNLSAAQAAQPGAYTVVLSNLLGSVTSAPPATVTLAPDSPIRGAVAAWGANDSRQTNVPDAALSGVIAIAAGGYHRSDMPGEYDMGHVLALKSDGSVLAWGANDSGQVTGTPGADMASALANPVIIQGGLLTGVRALAAGAHHSVALKDDGTVVAWGADFDGRVTGTPPADATYATISIASPVTFGTEVLRNVTAIAAGEQHTVALKNDGTVVAWGSNGSGQVTGTPPPNWDDTAIANPVTLGGHILSGVVAIAAGGAHTVALKSDGTVVAWGSNYEGQLTGTRAEDSNSEIAIANPVTLNGQVLSGVTAIEAGGDHTLALKNDGTVVAWGGNAAASPVSFQGQILSGGVAIAAGGNHSVALKGDGSIVAWGANNVGQTTIPTKAQSGAMAVAAAQNNTFAIVVPPPAVAPVIAVEPASQIVSTWQDATFTVTATGSPLNYQWRKDGVDILGATTATYTAKFAQPEQAGVYSVAVSNSAGAVNSLPAVLSVNPPSLGEAVAWGSDQYGETDVPPGLNGVTALAGGGSYTVALKADGSVVAWGKTWDDDHNVYVPVSVPVAAQNGIKAISAGHGHILALRNDGSVVAWGSNYGGQSSVPLAAQSGVIAIAAGAEHSLALKTDGSVVAWGKNLFGQVNVPLAAQKGVTAIAAGYWHNLALKNDGSVVAWGGNDSGEVTGNLNTGTSNVVSSVVLQGRILTGVTAIACGLEHSVALKTDGSVVAWGDDGIGQTDVPAGLSHVTAIAAGAYHTVALKSDGTVVAWGSNYGGEVTSTPTFPDPYFATANPVMLGGHVLSGVIAIAAGSDTTLALLGAVPLQPSLRAAASGNTLILSWPASAAGFKLQRAASLSGGTWTDVTTVPATEAGHFSMAEPMTGGSRFYRLVK